MSLIFSKNGGLYGPWVEHLLDSILQAYEKLKDLGFTYYNGNVSIIEIEENEK